MQGVSTHEILLECERLDVSVRRLQRMRSAGLVRLRRVGRGRGQGVRVEYEPNTVLRLQRVKALRSPGTSDQEILLLLWLEGYEIDERRLRKALVNLGVKPLVKYINQGGESASTNPGPSKFDRTGLTMIDLLRGKQDVIYPDSYFESLSEDLIESEAQSSREAIKEFSFPINTLFSVGGEQTPPIIDLFLGLESVRLNCMVALQIAVECSSKFALESCRERYGKIVSPSMWDALIGSLKQRAGRIDPHFERMLLRRQTSILVVLDLVMEMVTG